MLKVYNSLTHKKEEFVPLQPGKVGLYVCGVTVYDYCHIGHARCYISFDVIQRWLRRSYEVTFVRNFTDVDDKIIKRANENGEEPLALSARFIDAYHEDMDKLNVAKADIEPKVSTHMDWIIRLTEGLLEKEMAYRVPSESDVKGAGDDVFYRVEKFKNYMELSKKNLDDLRSGARVDVDSRKESPMDFALWKSAKPGEPFWESPYGNGRPGWHIECSAMSWAHLGTSFDIHGGGKDLVFPHHTNEIAQSEGCHGEKYAKYWLHNGFVNVKDEAKCPVSGKFLAEIPEAEHVTVQLGEDMYICGSADCAEKFKAEPDTYLKMSKSLGNFFTIREVLEKYSNESLRWLMVSTHYRNPIGFSDRLLEKAENRVAYLYETRLAVEEYLSQHEAVEGDSIAKVFARDGQDYNPWADFETFMNDDFNTAGAIGVFNEFLKVANLLVSGREKEWTGSKLKPPRRARLLNEWTTLLAKFTEVIGLGESDPESYLNQQRSQRSALRGIDEARVNQLIADRKTARENKDFAKADEIRDEINAMQVVLKDTLSGTRWTIQSDL